MAGFSVAETFHPGLSPSSPSSNGLAGRSLAPSSPSSSAGPAGRSLAPSSPSSSAGPAGRSLAPSSPSSSAGPAGPSLAPSSPPPSPRPAGPALGPFPPPPPPPPGGPVLGPFLALLVRRAGGPVLGPFLALLVRRARGTTVLALSRRARVMGCQAPQSHDGQHQTSDQVAVDGAHDLRAWSGTPRRSRRFRRLPTVRRGGQAAGSSVHATLARHSHHGAWSMVSVDRSRGRPVG